MSGIRALVGEVHLCSAATSTPPPLKNGLEMYFLKLIHVQESSGNAAGPARAREALALLTEASFQHSTGPFATCSLNLISCIITLHIFIQCGTFLGMSFAYFTALILLTLTLGRVGGGMEYVIIFLL